MTNAITVLGRLVRCRTDRIISPLHGPVSLWRRNMFSARTRRTWRGEWRSGAVGGGSGGSVCSSDASVSPVGCPSSASDFSSSTVVGARTQLRLALPCSSRLVSSSSTQRRLASGSCQGFHTLLSEEDAPGFFYTQFLCCVVVCGKSDYGVGPGAAWFYHFVLFHHLVHSP